VGSRLSAENRRILWVPPGFAHGFYITTREADVQYKCTDYYAEAQQRCIQWNDPALAIDWPLSGPPVLSDKDRSAGAFENAECFP
jgi:dTDP-4-dehydrorhamnose 3,5-epimerase